MTDIDIACRCGAVQLHIGADPVVQLYCHCDDCQTMHSAAYVKSAIYPAAAVQVTQGAPVAAVLRTTPRLRCAGCGTHLFSEIAAAGGLRSVNAYLLPAGAFKPQMHVNCQHALLPVVDDLPHYKAFPAAFGGSDEQVIW